MKFIHSCRKQFWISLIILSFGSEIISQSNEIPVLKIYTQDTIDIPNTKEYIYATGVLENLDNRQNLDSLKIRTRGNSTSSFPKKPYQIKLDESRTVLAMPEDERWVLLANYSDKTMLRTELAFELGRLSDLSYTPQSRFVEVKINDDYQGLYQLVQKVETTQNRVDIPDRAYLLEIEMRKRVEADDICFTTRRETICIKSPEIEKDSKRFREIDTKLNEIENLLFSGNFKDPVNGWRSIVDEEALIDWYLINEITKNNDAKFHTSVFMTYTPGQKLKMGPVWDFDISLGNIDYNGNEKPEGLWIKRAPWISRLYKDPEFVKQVKKRFLYFYGHKENLKQMLRTKSQQLSQAQKRNDQKWEVVGKKVWPNYKNFDTYQEEVDYLVSWLDTRFDWLNAKFEKM